MRSVTSSCASTSPLWTVSPSLTLTVRVGSDNDVETATFCNGAMMPAITSVGLTVDCLATAVGIGAGDDCTRVRVRPLPRWPHETTTNARPHATKANHNGRRNESVLLTPRNTTQASWEHTWLRGALPGLLLRVERTDQDAGSELDGVHGEDRQMGAGGDRVTRVLRERLRERWVARARRREVRREAAQRCGRSDR